MEVRGRLSIFTVYDNNIHILERSRIPQAVYDSVIQFWEKPIPLIALIKKAEAFRRGNSFSQGLVK